MNRLYFISKYFLDETSPWDDAYTLDYNNPVLVSEYKSSRLRFPIQIRVFKGIIKQNTSMEIVILRTIYSTLSNVILHNFSLSDKRSSCTLLNALRFSPILQNRIPRIQRSRSQQDWESTTNDPADEGQKPSSWRVCTFRLLFSLGTSRSQVRGREGSSFSPSSFSGPQFFTRRGIYACSFIYSRFNYRPETPVAECPGTWMHPETRNFRVAARLMGLG